MNEQAVIEAIINGNTERYKELVEKYQQLIFTTCLGFVRDEDEANDLTQDVFIQAYEKLNTFQFRSAFSTWIYRIAINKSLNVVRKKRRNIFKRISLLGGREAIEEIIPSENDSPDSLLIHAEDGEAIQKAIDKLSDKQKTAFVLSRIDELSQKEISLVMKTTEGAVESLIQRANVNLRKQLIRFREKKE